MNIYSLLLAFFASGVFLVGLFVFAKRQDEITIRFGIFSICVSVWAALTAVWFTQNYDYETTLTLNKVSNMFAAFMPITWLHFVLKFARKKEPFPYFYFSIYSISFVLMGVAIPTDLFVKDLHSILGFDYYTTPGPLYHLFTLQFLIFVPYGLYHLVSGYLKSEGVTRYQLKYLALGSIVGFASGASTILPIYSIPVPLYGLFSISLFPIFLGLALMKYGLFDEQQITDAFQREKLTAIGIMAASLNHELRNPLYVAKGRVETQLDFAEQGISKMDDKAKSSFDIVYSQLKRALEIIERFSNFAKPPMQDKKEDIVVKDAFTDVFHLVSKEFETRNIKVNQIPTNGLTVKANRRQFEEILFNLTMNACHAMSSMNTLSLEGEGNLPASGGGEGETPKELTFNASQPNGKVIVEISDNGPGIPKEDQTQIFDPFYTTKGKKGSGLGLYITKQLVERNNGKIKVKSKLGEGTQFKMEFPAK